MDSCAAAGADPQLARYQVESRVIDSEDGRGGLPVGAAGIDLDHGLWNQACHTEPGMLSVLGSVNVKATTGEEMGFVGRREELGGPVRSVAVRVGRRRQR